MNKIQTKIIRILFGADGNLESFTLFQRVGIPVFDLKIELDSLVRDEFVILKNFEVLLSPTGKEFVSASHFDAGSGLKSWREIPTEYCIPKLEGNELYTPSRKLLDGKTFICKKGN